MNILTITFHPTLDKYFVVKGLIPNSKIHAENLEIKSGGGGINISKVLHLLGTTSNAICFCGGRSTAVLEKKLTEENLNFSIISTSQEIRENIIITNLKNKEEFRFNMPLVELSNDNYSALFKELERHKNIDCLVISGSVGKGFTREYYISISQWAKNNNTKVIVDSKGDVLKMVCEQGAFLIKPNLKEFNHLTSSEAFSIEEIKTEAMKLLVQYPIENILISLGKRGVVLVSKNEMIMEEAPKILATNSVGAGDSLLAGLIFQLANHKLLKEAVRFGVLCGAATAINKDRTLLDLDDLKLIENNFMS